MTNPNVFDRLRLVALVSFVARVSPAAEQASVDSSTAADQLKALRDQTIIQSSVGLDTEWDHFDGGSGKAKVDAGSRMGMARSRTARLGFAI